MKKIFTWIAIAMVLIASVIGIVWLSTNWSALTSGSELYTQQQLEEYGQQKFDDGVSQSALYKEQVAEYKTQINDLLAEIKELQAEADRVPGLEGEVETLETKIAGLQAQVKNLEAETNRLENLLDSYEAIKEGTHEISFMVGENEVATYAVEHGELFESIDSVNADAEIHYNVHVYYWTIDNQQIDFSTYQVESNLTVYAVYDPIYNVVFEGYESYPTYGTSNLAYVNDIWSWENSEIYFSALGEFYGKGWKTLPQKEGYVFVGWTLDGQTIVEDFSQITVNEETVFKPVFEKATKIYSQDTWSAGYTYIQGVTNSEACITQKTFENEIVNINNVVFTYKIDGANTYYGRAKFGDVINFEKEGFSVEFRVGYTNDSVTYVITTSEASKTIDISLNNIYELI